MTRRDQQRLEDILWDIVENELPALRSDIEELLTRLEGGGAEPDRWAHPVAHAFGTEAFVDPRDYSGVS